jgi:photosystem II stability/assembly factor-like uncharacterized protein
MRFTRISLVLCLLPFAAPLAADWTRIGPDGGDVSALAVAPSQPALLYAATQTGSVFKSLDRGQTWSFAGWPNTLLSDLAVDPRTRSLVYGAGPLGILKSTDGGASWAEVRRGGPIDQITGVEVNPHNGIVFALGARNLWRSNDRGVTWKTEGRWPEHVDALVFDPERPTVVYAGALEGLFRSGNGGRTWQPWGQGLPADAVIGSLAIDPRSPRTLWAGISSGQGSVFKSTDGGATWKPTRGLLNRYVQSLLVDPASSSILLANAAGELFRSTNGGVAWTRAGNGLREHVTDLDAAPYGLLAGTRSGISLSTDRGLTWRDRQRGLTALWIAGLAIDAQDPPRLYAGDRLAGIFKTRDRGASWLRLGELEDPLSWDRPLAVDPAVPETVYTTAITSVAKSTNGGRRWELHEALNCGVPTLLQIDPREPGTLYTSGFLFSTGCSHVPNACVLAASRDAGATWSCIQEGLPPLDGRALLGVDPFTSAVYVRTSAGAVWHSLDHGATWTELAQGVDPFSFAASPLVEGTLYAGTQGGVRRSLDGGQTWTFTAVGPSADWIVGLALHPTDSSKVYAASLGHGIFESTDGGVTWSQLGTWEPGRAVRSGPVIDPVDPSILYVGTGEASVWRFEPDGQ